MYEFHLSANIFLLLFSAFRFAIFLHKKLFYVRRFFQIKTRKRCFFMGGNFCVSQTWSQSYRSYFFVVTDKYCCSPRKKISKKKNLRCENWLLSGFCCCFYLFVLFDEGLYIWFELFTFDWFLLLIVALLFFTRN